MFLSRRYKPNKWPFFGILAFEIPLTIALLALFGIAAPNLYRTKLWQDGADNGFNSSPLTGLYAAANYRPYKTPRPWSQFITNYNVVISVFSMFLMIVKSIMYLLHVFPPILSVVVHAVLIILYAVSVDWQASADTTDPAHPQKGAPWYITKSCSVTHNKSLLGYCKQAKASFACTCAMLVVFVFYFGFALWSCFPSKAQKLEYAEKRQAKAERYARLERAEAALRESAHTSNYLMPETPGIQSGLNPMTPRTLAFNTLGGTRDLPLRNHFSSPNAPTSPSFAIRSPDLPRSPMSPGFVQAQSIPQPQTQEHEDVGRAISPDMYEDPRQWQAPQASPRQAPPPQPTMFFPPPPKVSSKGKK